MTELEEKFIMTEKNVNRNFYDEYIPLENLGQPGQFGYAKKCKNRKSNKIFAVKIVNKAKFKFLSQKQKFYSQLKGEINIMRKLNHKNIIRFFDVYEDELSLYIIMECCTGGELFDRISQKGSYSEHDAAIVLRQLADGINYLHLNKIAHCDLKPDNLLFKSKEENSPLKIIDFGMAKIVHFRTYLKKLSGTPYYIAPEVLEEKYTEACDMWSFGVVMFVMIFGYPPFYHPPNENRSEEKIMEKVKSGFIPITKNKYGPWFPSSIKCSESAKDLIARLLVKDHANRLTATEVLAHPWISGDTAIIKSMDPDVLTSLKSFRQTCKFKQAILHIMINHLTDFQVNDLKKMFKKIDKDGNGEISQEELKEALKEIDRDINDYQVRKIMSEIDINKDGVCSYDELCMVAIDRKLISKEERLWNVFRLIDTNNDGEITVEEFKEAIKGTDLGENFISEAENILAEVDINKDGSINYSELLGLFFQNKG